MRAAAAILLLVASGCGPRGPVVPKGGASENQIERLSTLKVEPVDPSASARLQPLQIGDPTAGPPGSGLCDFSLGGAIYLVASPVDSVARTGGRVLHLVPSGPFGETGGFFEDRQISISVGRDRQAAGAGQAGRWPARLVSTNRRTRAHAEMAGLWSCEPGARAP